MVSLGMVSYSHSIATMAVSLALLTQYTNVTDTQRASQTLHDGIGTASSGKIQMNYNQITTQNT